METLDYADCQSGSEEDRTVGFNSIDALQLAQLEFERRAQITTLAGGTTQPAQIVLNFCESLDNINASKLRKQSLEDLVLF